MKTFSFTPIPLKVILSQLRTLQIQQQIQAIVLIQNMIMVSTLVYKIRYQKFIAKPESALPPVPPEAFKVKESFQQSQNREYKLIVQVVTIFLTIVLILFTVIR